MVKIAGITKQARKTTIGIMGINQNAFLSEIHIKRIISMIGIRSGIMNIGITISLIKVTEASLTVVIIINLTDIKTMNIITRDIGIPGEIGKDIKEFIQDASIMGGIITMMGGVFFSGFVTRMAMHTFSIQSEDNSSFRSVG